jgi:hypothetical protein
VLKFKNISGDTLEVRGLRPYDSTPVDANGFAEVDGTLVEERPPAKDGEPEPEPLPEDAYIVDLNGVERAWPKALWELDAPKKTQPKPADKESVS